MRWTMRSNAVACGIMIAGCSCLAQDIPVGVVWEGSSAFSEMTLKGMSEYLSKNAPQIKLEVKKQIPMEALKETAAQFGKEKKAVVILRSSGAKCAMDNPLTVPMFIGATNNPVEIGTVKNLAAPEGNVTGVTYYVPAEVMMATFKTILPKMRNVLLLVETGHPGSPIASRETSEWCKKSGVEFAVKECVTKADALAAVKEVDGKCSAIIIPTISLFNDNAKELVAAAPATPFLSYSEKPVETGGALAGLSADNVKLGGMLGESLVDVLVKGKAVKAVPVKIDDKPQLYVNVVTAERLKIDVPMHVLKSAKIIEK